MWDKIKKAWRKLHRFLLETILQKVVLGILLAVTYFTVLGLTSIVLRIWGRRFTAQRTISADTYWIKAEGYELERDSCLDQS